MSYSRIEIRQLGGEKGLFTEIYVDGHKLNGVRRFELKQETGNSLPILTVDLNALDLSTDVKILKMNQYGMGNISEITFKCQPDKNFIYKMVAEMCGMSEDELRSKIFKSWEENCPNLDELE